MPHDPRALAAHYESDARAYAAMRTPGGREMAATLRRSVRLLREQADREDAERAAVRASLPAPDTAAPFDAVAFIMDAEGGELEWDSYLGGMGEMIARGIVWKLQGSWQRAARNLIDAGHLSESGEVL
jgi:hypothetical protein